MADTGDASYSDYCVSPGADAVYIMEVGYNPMIHTVGGKSVALDKIQFRYAKCAGLY